MKVFNKFLMVCLVFSFFTTVQSCNNDKEIDDTIDPNDTIEKQVEEAFGFQLNNFLVERDTIKEGDNISLLLARHNFDGVEIANIVERVKDSFQLRKIQMGKTLTLLKDKKAPHDLQYLIYHPDNYSFSVINFKDSIYAYNEEFPITYKTKCIAGNVTGSFSESIEKEGADPSMAQYLATKFAWSIDFLKMQDDDRFALYFTEKYINDSIYVGIEELMGAYFHHKGRDIYGFAHTPQGEKTEIFFDENGKQMKTMFLKSPLKYYRITSRYSKSRLHPVQKIFKAHKGTDYAAPTGTPIMSTADGVVVEAGNRGGNGRFVKIKHNDTYTTQYLHMSKILVKQGQRVKQGQVIGKVGSTGLATGPHLCYRFWKNGVQVDPFKQNLPTSTSLSGSELNEYLSKIKPIQARLDEVIQQKFSK